jgi:hypothetical protein
MTLAIVLASMSCNPMNIILFPATLDPITRLEKADQTYRGRHIHLFETGIGNYLRNGRNCGPPASYQSFFIVYLELTKCMVTSHFSRICGSKMRQLSKSGSSKLFSMRQSRVSVLRIKNFGRRHCAVHGQFEIDRGHIIQA